MNILLVAGFLLLTRCDGFKPLYKPMNPKQEKLEGLLRNPKFPIVVVDGVAGTGKTLLSTQYAIQMLEEDKIKKIVLTRPTIYTGPDIGYLPGSLDEKMNPWLMPMLDVFSEYYRREKMKRMLDEKTVEIVPLGFMRGRSFKNCVILADEMQNSYPEQMKMLLTRIGSDSRLIITGDIKQSDLKEVNGLEDFLERLDKKYSDSQTMFQDGVSLVRFDQNCIERHPVITKILSLYD